MNDQPPEILVPSELARLLDKDWREAAVYGGRNSLKSHTVARILLTRAMQAKTRVGCFREFQSSIKDSSHQLLSDLVMYYDLREFKVTKDGIVNTRTGSDFLFNGLRNNVQSVKSIEGIDVAWVEEAQTISEASLEVLTPTVRKPGSQIIYTYNRLRDKDPIHERLVIDGRPNTLILNVNYDIALKYGWMSDALRLEMEDDKAKRPEVYKHKWLGEPSTMKGLIYPNWKKITKVPAEAKYLGPGLDFGYTNDPTAVIDVYKWNNAYILDEIVYERGLSNRQIANHIRVSQGLEKVSDLDNSYEGSTRELTVGDSSEPKSIDDIAQYGVTIIGAAKGKDSVNNGIQRMQELEIYYTEMSHNIEEEQLNYIWRVDKEDKSLNVPIDAYNHAMDAARYKIMDIENFKPVEWGGVR
jgi:phage terminase large subunit